jgi:hypothetical protein
MEILLLLVGALVALDLIANAAGTDTRELEAFARRERQRPSYDDPRTWLV